MGNNACSKDDVASGFVLQTILEKKKWKFDYEKCKS